MPKPTRASKMALTTTMI